MKKISNFTVIPNEILEDKNLTLQARFLFFVLIKFSWQKDFCFPSQKTLSLIMNRSDRQIRTYLKELELAELISVNRMGYNTTNTYKLVKKYRKYTSYSSGNVLEDSSSQPGKLLPLLIGNDLPPNNTHLKTQDKNTSSKGLDSLRETMLEIGLLVKKPVP